MVKSGFYTEKRLYGYYGLSRSDPSLVYGPNRTRDAALSGVKRLAKKNVSKQLGVKVAKKKINRVAFVIDRSASMNGIISAALNALNQNIETVRQQAKTTGQETEVTVVVFDDRIDVVRDAANALYVKDVMSSEVVTRGLTALNDAVGAAIDRLSRPSVKDSEDVSYLVITVTDGEENSSSLSNSGLSAQIRSLQATDRWTFTFLVPQGSRETIVNRLGVYHGNVAEWEQSVRGVQTYASANIGGTQSFYSNRSFGVNSVQNFYTDLSNLTTKQVKNNLDDLSNRFRVLSVDKEEAIRNFVERKTGKPYVPGSGYYQLTKGEKKVQDYKKLLVMEKNKSAVYGGPDAKQVLGIPDGTLSVKPGNHGNFDIFVQSTSVNRKLVRGTKLLVEK